MGFTSALGRKLGKARFRVVHFVEWGGRNGRGIALGPGESFTLIGTQPLDGKTSRQGVHILIGGRR